MKFQPDVGWNAKIGGYLCRVLVTPNDESGQRMWQAWAKSLDNIVPGIGRTQLDAIAQVKDHMRSFLSELVMRPVALNEEERKKLKGAVDLTQEGRVKIPWTEITCFAPMGSSVKWVLIDGIPGPDGKMPEKKEEKQEANGRSDA